jgi:hypothetical protein
MTCWSTRAPVLVLVAALTPAWAHAQEKGPQPFAGTYTTRAGEVMIKPKRDASFSVQVNASDPQAGRWTCEFAGEGRLQPDGTLLAQDRSGGEPARLRLVLARDWLRVTDVSAPTAKRGYCGLNGTVDGVYRRKGSAARGR